MTIRSLEAADLPAVYELDQKAGDVHWSMAQWEKELALTQAHFFIGWESALVGFVGYWSVAGEAQMMNVVVAPDFRQRGLGRQLVDHVLAHARANACTRCTLEVRHTNTPAQRLYTTAGFQRTGTRPRFYPDADAILMERPL